MVTKNAVFMRLVAFCKRLNNIYKGEELLPLIPDKETLFRVTDAAITFFEKNANPSERFRKTLQRVGEEDFRKQLKDAYEGQ